ncbi:hypothetical protein AOLI_G00243370 [Acnodon oligacanthus]
MANISQVLLDTLQNLGVKDLKLFQWKLTSGVEGFKSIPKALLENADRLDTVDKMVASYELRGAVAITLDILKNMNQNQLAEELWINLRESGDICEEATYKSPAASSTAPQTKCSNSALIADGEQSHIRRTTKTKFRAKLAKLYEGTSFEGDFMPLKDVYTELYVTEGCTGGVNPEHEDSGVELLCTGLRSSPCKLEVLRLAGCNITLNSCESLCSTLKSAKTLLMELDLSNNDLQDSGLELLSGGLKSSHCKLQILRLDNCNLRVELLSAGLMSSDCNLEVLRLSMCKINFTEFTLLSGETQISWL